MSELTATHDLAPTARPMAGPGASAAGFRGIIRNLRGLAAQPAVARALPAIGLIAVIGLAAMIWMDFSAPPARTLFSGLADNEKAAVVEALRGGGIDYSIDSGTGAIQVSESDYHQARMMLAGQGLPRSGPEGSEMIGSLPLGASRAVEGERIRGARELDLARTIEGIDVVQSARVHLAVEAPSVFVRNRAQPAASVMLTATSQRMSSPSRTSRGCGRTFTVMRRSPGSHPASGGSWWRCAGRCSMPRSRGRRRPPTPSSRRRWGFRPRLCAATSRPCFASSSCPTCPRTASGPSSRAGVWHRGS